MDGFSDKDAYDDSQPSAKMAAAASFIDFAVRFPAVDLGFVPTLRS